MVMDAEGHIDVVIREPVDLTLLTLNDELDIGRRLNGEIVHRTEVQVKIANGPEQDSASRLACLGRPAASAMSALGHLPLLDAGA